MTETMFEDMVERLKADISKEISYAYVVFVPNDTKRVISEMKRNIYLSDRKFLGQDLQKSLGNNLIFPYDVLNSGIEKHISDFYDEISLNSQTKKSLVHTETGGKNLKRSLMSG